MDESKKIFYENVIPSINNKTVDIKFKDSNDLILDEKKNTEINFAKKLNNFSFLIVTSFLLFIIFSLYKVYFDSNKKKNIYKKVTPIDRGKILDRNGEIIATNINTEDLYIDTRKVLDSYDLKKEVKGDISR